MNTSDKSIVSLDTALRRRFWFKEMLPDYSLEGLQKDIEWINLSGLLQKINNRIEYLLDKNHLIWHSYFLKTNNISDLKLVIYNEILPLLEEYFYWEEEKIRKVLGSIFFEEKKEDYKLFEKKEDFESDEKSYEIKKDLSDDDFIEAIKNIIKSNEEN
jgi:5-methylcytosine-specific restriction protein B